MSLQNIYNTDSDRSKSPSGFKLDLDKCLSVQDQSYPGLLLLDSTSQEECYKSDRDIWDTCLLLLSLKLGENGINTVTGINTSA